MKNTKKGFTIVELVIVIAVIAILAAVLIPTFSGIIDKANISSAEQEARNSYVQYAADNATEANFIDTMIIETSKGYYVFINNGSVVNEGKAKTIEKADFTTTDYQEKKEDITVKGEDGKDKVVKVSYILAGDDTTKYYAFKLEGKSLETTEYTPATKSGN